MRFEGVYFIPKLTDNIVSVGQLDLDGYQVLIGGGKLLAWVDRMTNRLYLLTMKLSTEECLAAREDGEAWCWHEHLSHISFTAMKKMAKEELVRGLPDLTPSEQPCTTCLAGKQRRTSFLAQAQYQADMVLELVHRNLCSKISPPTAAGNQYFLLLIDGKYRFMSGVLLPSKDRAAHAIKKFKLRAESETRRKFMGLRTDRGGEFNSENFGEFCLE
jgi:hypothetical protein